MRRSTVFFDHLTETIDEYGGLIDFYRSPQEPLWTDSGPNVPYDELIQEWQAEQ